MQVHTVRDLGALVRTARRAHGLTQAELADRLRVSRDRVIRLERAARGSRRRRCLTRWPSSR